MLERIENKSTPKPGASRSPPPNASVSKGQVLSRVQVRPWLEGRPGLRPIPRQRDDPSGNPNLAAVVGAFAGIGEGLADFEAEIVEVELLALGDRLAAGLTLGLFRRTGDVDGDVHLDSRGAA